MHAAARGLVGLLLFAAARFAAADAVVTWGPDGGVGHPDHRLVSDIARQL